MFSCGWLLGTNGQFTCDEKREMRFLTREFFDTLIIVIIIIGLAWAAVRLYADLTRPLPPEMDDEDTPPTKPNDK